MRRLFLFVIVFSVWIILTWIPTRPAELFAGFIASIITAFFFKNVFSVKVNTLFNPKRIFVFIFKFVPMFTYYCIKANIDVAYRVLHPKMPIKPGIVKIKTNLKSPVALTWLANSITLTPGTLTVDLIDDHLYIHWINVQAEDVGRATAIISEKFEKVLQEVFE